MNFHGWFTYISMLTKLIHSISQCWAYWAWFLYFDPQFLLLLLLWYYWEDPNLNFVFNFKFLIGFKLNNSQNWKFSSIPPTLIIKLKFKLLTEVKKYIFYNRWITYIFYNRWITFMLVFWKLLIINLVYKFFLNGVFYLKKNIKILQLNTFPNSKTLLLVISYDRLFHCKEKANYSGRDSIKWRRRRSIKLRKFWRISRS